MTSKPRMIDPPYLFSSEDVLMNLMKYEHDWLIFHPKNQNAIIIYDFITIYIINLSVLTEDLLSVR